MRPDLSKAWTMAPPNESRCPGAGFLRNLTDADPSAALAGAEPAVYPPVISLSPSRTRPSSSSDARAWRLPMRSTDRVRDKDDGVAFLQSL
jgi:hypothetical protein